MFVAEFAVLAAAVIGCCSSQKIEMSVLEEKDVFKMGETISLKCVVTGSNAIPLGWVLDWHKLLTDGEKVHIGTNTRVEQTVEENAPGHFEMTAVNEDIDGQSLPVFTLKIKDVKHVDSGSYQCGISPSESYHDNREVTVYKKPEKLSMEVDDGNGFSVVAEPKEFTLGKNAKLEVKCTSSGGNPASRLEIKVGDKLVESTDSSQRKSEAGSFRYDELITFDVIKTATIQVDSPMDGGKVSCQNVDDEGNVLYSQEFSIKLKGAAPVIECESNNITRALGDTRVNITCLVQGSPPVTEQDVVFYWFPKNVKNKTMENRESVQPNEVNGHYSAEMVQTEDGVQITLLIDRLYPQAFRKYHVYVSNSKGPTEEVITLHRDYTVHRTDAASSCRMSVAMIGIAIILNLVFGPCQ